MNATNLLKSARLRSTVINRLIARAESRGRATSSQVRLAGRVDLSVAYALACGDFLHAAQLYVDLA